MIITVLCTLVIGQKETVTKLPTNFSLAMMEGQKVTCFLM